MVKTIFDYKCPFYDYELLFLKRKKRKCERLYQKTWSLDLKADFDLNAKIYFDKFPDKRSLFINNVLHGKCTRQKYALLKALLGKEEQILPKCENTESLARDFNKFFISKVGNIIASIQATECPAILPLTNKQFCAFTLLSLSDLKKLLTASTTSTSTLDRIATRIVKSFPNELSSVVLNLINFSLDKGVFAHTHKQAIVKPHIKNVNLDPEDFSNYRPISNLSYTSKLLEGSALVQLTDHIESNAMFCPFQSAYEKLYSIESAQLKVNDMLLNLEQKRSTFYIGLDLSAAFDTLDHDILLSILDVSLGFRGSVLSSLKSHLISRSQRVLIKDGVFQNRK